MRVVDHPPVAETLLEAMRAVGYSFETAVADILDNSITALATNIDVSFSPYDEPYVAILDNGRGMDADELRIAMRHGSTSSLLERSSTDLGRFGLGLKTASLSQCRCLTVVSLKSGDIVGARWDLDAVIRHKSWALLELDQADFDLVPLIDKLRQLQSGTIVVWQSLDRIFEGESQQDRALQDKIDDARNHLGLVFHRFLEGATDRPRLTIRINNLHVTAADPFLRGCEGGQTLPPEHLSIHGHRVYVEAYILPHISRLSAEQIERAGGDDGLRRNQGFYVYRNFRLITWGTWFRLAKQEEMSKLARVIVDVPNALDHLWKLDIKKSSAHPPEEVRKELHRIVERIADRSKRVYTHRGRKTTAPGAIHAWDRIEHRSGKIAYKINREHDLFNAVRSAMPEAHGRLLERFVQSLEELFPFDALYADMAGERRMTDEESGSDLEDSLTEMAQLMLDAFGRGSEEARKLRERLHLLDPFSKHRELTSRIMERLI
jgi:hypothetical protein